MKIKILQQDLLPVLQSVSRSIGTKVTLPVLANILLQTEAGKLKLSATNLELGIIKSVRAEILEDGEITVPARMFLELVLSLGSDEIEISTENEIFNIKSNSFNAKINSISANEFPVIPVADKDSILINRDIFLKSLPQVTFSAASDEGRPILTGVLTEIKKDCFEVISTDGFRLAHKKIKNDNKTGFELRVLVPKKTLDEVVKIIDEETTGKDEENIEISTTENQNQIIFKIGNTILSSRLIEGQFPQWEKIIPQKIEQRVILERSELLKSCKLASVFAKGDSNIIKIETLEDKVKLTSEAKETGSQETEISAQIEGEKTIISFNSKYLIDVLNFCPGSQISMEFSGSLSACIIKPVGDEGLQYVLMPIRTS